MQVKNDILRRRISKVSSTAPYMDRRDANLHLRIIRSCPKENVDRYCRICKDIGRTVDLLLYLWFVKELAHKTGHSDSYGMTRVTVNRITRVTVTTVTRMV